MPLSRAERIGINVLWAAAGLVVILTAFAHCDEPKAPEETWYVHYDPRAVESALSVEDRKAGKTADDYLRGVMETCERIYAPWRIRFVLAGPAKAGYSKKRNVVELLTGPLVARAAGYAGQAPRIDEGNTGPDHLVGPLFGVFIDVGESWQRRVNPSVSFETRTTFAGTILAHEVGHALGMSHVFPPAPDIMSPAFIKPDGSVAQTGFQLVHRIYLSAILGDRQRKEND